MKVLLLSPNGDDLSRIIRHAGDQGTLFRGLKEETTLPLNYDFVVMFNWRKIIKDPHLKAYHGRIINIHTSFLPWNRGAYPNLFSWVENTPKGVTIHHVNGGIDMGRIIVRSHVDFSKAPNTTLKSSYEALQEVAVDLFENTWKRIRSGISGTEQNPQDGSYHTMKDAASIIASLPDGWDTKVSYFDDIQSTRR